MRYLIFFMMIFMSLVVKAQTDSTATVLPLKPAGMIFMQIFPPTTSIDSLKMANLRIKKNPLKSHWKQVNKIGLDLNEVAFVNWNTGGNNSISGLLGLAFKRNYNRKNIHWANEFLLQYGLNKQKDQDFRKTDDNVEINSTFGYQKDTLSPWYYSAKFNFNTQISEGYSYPNTEKAISGFLAPAYLFLGVGSEYRARNERFEIYASPLTMKYTFVLDQRLADAGAFGVEPAILDENGEILKSGLNLRKQIGILLTNEYNLELFENIFINNKLSLYTDYLNRFGNVDINWELNFTFKVNEYVVAKLGSHLKYDDDIKIKTENAEGELIEQGPAVQWKQQLGIGVIVNL